MIPLILHPLCDKSRQVDQPRTRARFKLRRPSEKPLPISKKQGQGENVRIEAVSILRRVTAVRLPHKVHPWLDSAFPLLVPTPRLPPVERRQMLSGVLCDLPKTFQLMRIPRPLLSPALPALRPMLCRSVCLSELISPPIQTLVSCSKCYLVMPLTISRSEQVRRLELQ